MPVNRELKDDVRGVIEAAYRLSEDVGAEVESALSEGREHPLNDDELHALLRNVITVMRERAADRGSSIGLDGDVDELVRELLREGRRSNTNRNTPSRRRLALEAHNGIEPGPVFPKPMFHGREIPMRSGWIRTRDIDLWRNNHRLEIHVAQFTQQRGRKPDPGELLDMMLSKVALPGISKKDQFAIEVLARSIATNGVRKPPIIDTDGTLLDGNRRLTACHYIINSDEFGTVEKRRAENLFVWQLSDFATDDDRATVVVSLNFEPDHKQDWPEFIKARTIYEEWESMISLEPSIPNQRRQAQMKRELSQKYALGPSAHHVTRYLKMMRWADQFAAHHVEEKGRDPHEVQHRSSEVFQYFEELAKGQSEGGVAHTLGQDDTLRLAAFDLLFDGRFKNWNQIRDLKLVGANEDAREMLIRACDEPDDDLAEDLVEDAIALARARRAEERKVGANTRIEAFVKFLLDLPVGAFSDGTIKSANLALLLNALRRVKDVVADGLAGNYEGG